jgi:hypothetical protein
MVEDSDAGNNGVGGGITKRIRWDLEFNVGVWDGYSMHLYDRKREMHIGGSPVVSCRSSI